jgi:ArsR family transcriptional regulator
MAVDVKQAAEELAWDDVVSALADGRRRRIVELLAAEELCVCHLVEELGIAQPLVSHHLRVLREAGLVDSERYRYWTYYRLRPRALVDLAERLSAVAGQALRQGRQRRPCC